MKKLILMMSSIITVSPIINDCNIINSSKNSSNIIKTSAENVTKKTESNKKSFSSDDKGMFLYDTTVNINQFDNKPFGNQKHLDAQNNDENQYLDNVYLKSLQWDNTKKIVVSSLDNLKAKDKDAPAQTWVQDQMDYALMQSLTSKTNPKDTALQEGMATLNRYVNGSIVGFNNVGYIPTRDTFFGALKNGTLKDIKKQNVITFKDNGLSSKMFADDSDKASFSIHWYGVSMNLPEKYMTTPVTDYLNDAFGVVQYSYDALKKSKSSIGANDVPSVEWLLETFFKVIKENAGLGNSMGTVRDNFLKDIQDIWEDLDSDTISEVSSAIDEQKWLPSPESEIPYSFSEDVAEISAESEELLTEAVEEVDAATVEIPVVDIIVEAVTAAITIGFAVWMGLIMNKPFKDSSGSTNKLINMVYDSKTGKLNKINSALVNFKGEFSTNWNGTSQSNIDPVYPSVVPEAVITPASVSPILNQNYDVITGINSDFNVILDPTTWEQFIDAAGQDEGDDSVNTVLKLYGIFNANLYMTDDDWYDIYNQLKYTTLDENSVAVMHIVNKKVVYCNIVDDTGKTNLQYDTSAYLKESFIGTDLQHMDFIATKLQQKSLVQTYNWVKNCWNDHTVAGKVIPGISDNPIDNPDHYKTYQEWYYNTYIKDTYWTDKNLDEKTIEAFIDKFVDKYNKGFTNKEYVAITNNSNGVVDVSSTILDL